ncbi:MAG TPA: Plug domain-containing protein, partial [Phenylobacterium sp.]|nr:Plug domain-containing protein [Phenylobacterium sp.]
MSSASLLLGSTAAQAQSAGASDPAMIEEVIVTAQKRAERLIDTPQSVTALSSAELTKLGAKEFVDFAATVPGLQFTTQGPGSSQISLRGVTSGVDVGPTVGIYVDEVPYGSSSAFTNGPRRALDVGLFDIERVEVLRGPQGTLYGASSMGGVLKYVTRAPILDEFSGAV